MKLARAREIYAERSTKASEVIRQLGLAGIAVIWLFKNGADSVGKIPSDLQWPLIFIIGGLAFDLLQYATAALLWGSYQFYKYKKGTSEEEEIFPNEAINWPALIFFTLKIISIIVAYFLIWNYVRNIIF
jgi:hypothetical protein